jgi:hypothetical protein
MPAIHGGSAADQTQIQGEVRKVLSRLTTTITDADLQSGIRKKATGENVVFIGGGDCHTHVLAYHEQWTFGPFTIKSDDIHICLRNHRGAAKIDDTLIHEWAHTCGWEHGDGKGVPL